MLPMPQACDSGASKPVQLQPHGADKGPPQSPHLDTFDGLLPLLDDDADHALPGPALR